MRISLTILFFLTISLSGAPCAELFSNKNQHDSLRTGWYFVVDSNGYKIQLDKSNKLYQLYPIPIISKNDIKSVKVVLTKNSIYALEMDFNSKASKVWDAATDKSFKEYSELAFVINGKLVYTAIAKQGKISNGKSAIIRSDYSKTEIEEMKSILQN